MAFDDTIERSTRPPTDWDSKDMALAAAKGALSNFPIVGGSAGELFGLAIASPLAKRRDDWLESLAIGLLEVRKQGQGFTFEALAENPQFVSTVMQATAAAISTHQVEKLEALRNAVVNTAMRIPINHALQQMFITFVRDLTEWHLRILELLQDPPAWLERHGIPVPSWSMGGRSRIVEHAFPELVGRRDFYDQIVRDLHMRGLLVTDSLHVTVTGEGLFQPLSSEMGSSFLTYIHRR